MDSGAVGGIEVSVVVPTYNEEKNIGTLLRALDEALHGIPYEVVIVDDASQDKTIEVANATPISGHLVVYRKPKRTGKPESLAIGLKVARGRYISFLDADLEYPPKAIAQMYHEALETNADIIAAARIDKRPLHRRVISWGAKLLAKLMIRELRRLRDPTTELILAKKEALVKVGFEKYAKYIKPITAALRHTAKLGYRIAEVPVEVTPRQHGSSSFKTKWITAYLKELMDLTDWLIPKYIAIALVAALIAHVLNPAIGIASLAMSLAIRYIPLRRLINPLGLITAEATSTALKIASASLIGLPLAWLIASALEVALVMWLR
ncbi:glycosyltransferase [Pyrobaculum calidifontis]|uniref:Glycosyl transferase, family 2 n=1 Tax=Pyrobaculum calidifontis (strain DSM 21063 / JCM 11548 / VA1) TaxID=410359 RepID=A3MTE5_PYRCJ|nr:glycosyltransferase [Pyrobaculum calidifontis]ABO07912.1 glycosyl transferase, family 2 [Pyrobaculum calidifontis JCM 11548]